MPNLKHNYDRDEIGGRVSYPNMVKGGPGSAGSLAVEPVYAGDEFVELWISIDGDGPSLKLAPQQCHELGGELLNLARVLGFDEQVKPERFARQIRERRERFGWTQRQIAARGGPSTETLRLIEGAHRSSYSSRLFAQLDRSLAWSPGTALRAWEGAATDEELSTIPTAVTGG